MISAPCVYNPVQYEGTKVAIFVWLRSQGFSMPSHMQAGFEVNMVVITIKEVEEVQS